MRHPPGHGQVKDPWCVFRTRLEAGRTVRDYGERGMTQKSADNVCRVLNSLQRTRFGARRWYAAPEKTT